MLQGSAQGVTNRLTLDRIFCSLNKEELRQFFRILEERAKAAADIEVSHYEQGTLSEEDFEKNKILLKSLFEIRPTITSANGPELFGTVDDVFTSPNFPDVVKSVYVNSETTLKALHNYFPRNKFQLSFDFNRPTVFDFTIGPSERTPNESHIEVVGVDATWANGVFYEIKSFIDDHKATAPWLHRHTIYDIFLWNIGYPIAFWFCFKLSDVVVQLTGGSPFLQAGGYLYLFLVALLGFRTLFHYARWVFPAFEYRHDKSKAFRHRLTLSALSVGLLGSLLYDILKVLFLPGKDGMRTAMKALDEMPPDGFDEC